MSTKSSEVAARYAELRDADADARRAALPWVIGELRAPGGDSVRALELLGYWGELRHLHVPADVAETVIELTRASDPAVRREACATLALLRVDGPHAPARALIAALDDGVPQVRQEAAAALGDLRAASARPALARGLDDAHPAVRFECALALSALGDDSGREVLSEALGSPAFRAYAIEGLRRLADPSAVEPLRRVARSLFIPWPERLAAQAALASFGDAGAEAHVGKRARRGRHEVRAYALYLIGHGRLRGLKSVVDAIAEDARDSLRATAVQAVGRFGDPADDVRLQGWLHEGEAASDVRLEALDALAERGIDRVRRLNVHALPPELRARAREWLDAPDAGPGA